MATKLLKRNFDNVFTGSSVGVPMTPGRWVDGKVKYKKITKLTMTCGGGGLGGSRWDEYVERINDDVIMGGDTFIKVKDVDGITKILNKNYIVAVDSELTVAEAKYNSNNGNFETGVYTCQLLVRDGHKVTLIPTFDSKAW